MINVMFPVIFTDSCSSLILADFFLQKIKEKTSAYLREIHIVT
ncbi:hypothetical protein GGU45_001126 [Niabella hirudinis]